MANANASNPLPWLHAVLAVAVLHAVTAAGVDAQPVAREGTKAVRVLRVGPKEAHRTIDQAARAAMPGDTVEIIAGDYVADVAIWERDHIRIVGVGGRPRLIAGGKSAEGKAIFLVRANGIEIENLEFVGARAPDHYGSGVRLEKGSLRISKSRFEDNEMAIMTANYPDGLLEVIDCEFSGLINARHREKVLSHTLYAGSIDVLRVEGSYFRRGSVGHLLKSRARRSEIRYNRLTDEDGISSYELEFPDGGHATVIGNLIQQGPRSENPTIVSFGAEGAKWPVNRLDALFNTVVNDQGGSSTFVAVRPQSAQVNLRYNVLVGSGSNSLPDTATVEGNVNAQAQEFSDPARFDYRPRLDTQWVGAATGANAQLPNELLPGREFQFPVGTLPLARRSIITPLSPGAFQRLGPAGGGTAPR